MKVPLALLALLCALATPAAAQRLIDLGTLWSLPIGSDGDPTGPEGDNRRRNLVRRADIWRAPIQITESGNFDPNGGNVLLQEGWTYRTAIAAADDAGFRLLLNFLVHQQGTHDGTGYHNSQGDGRGPILDPDTVDRFVGQFMEWLDSTHPNIEVYGWQLGNETYGYCPHDCPPVSQRLSVYLAAWDRIRPRFPAGWKRVGGGVLVETDAPAHVATSRNMIASVHCNGAGNSACRELLRSAKTKYGKAMIDEDRHPSSDHSHAPQRVQIAIEEGAEAYFTFSGRNSGNPPLGTCRWGVHPTGKANRNHVGVEGCEWAWQDTQGFSMFRRALRRIRSVFNESSHPGSYPNWQKLTQAAQIAGTFVPGQDLPNRVGGEPPPSGDVPPGMHQFCVFINLSFRARGLPHESPEDCKNDPARRAIYETWLQRLGLPN